MNIAVLSCIHGNLEALEAVLRDIDQQPVDQIYCLGDLVGYGPYPNEVVARIRELDIPIFPPARAVGMKTSSRG